MFKSLFCAAVVISMSLPAFAEPVDKSYVPEYEGLTPAEAETLDRIPDAEGEFDACTVVLPTKETVCEFLARLEKQHPGYLKEEEKAMCRECKSAE